MDSSDNAAAKRERIKAISRTVHSIPVEEGGQLRPARPVGTASPPRWQHGALAGLAVGLLAGFFAARHRLK